MFQLLIHRYSYFHPHFTGRQKHIFITTSRKVNHNGFTLIFRYIGIFHCISNGMGAFKCRNYPLTFREQFKTIEGFFIGNSHIIRPSGDFQIGMFRAHPGIIESCRNRMSLRNLPIIILKDK